MDKTYVVAGQSTSSQVEAVLRRRDFPTRTKRFTAKELVEQFPEITGTVGEVSAYLSRMNHDVGAVRVVCKRGQEHVYVIRVKRLLESSKIKRRQHRGPGFGPNRTVKAPQERHLRRKSA